jgi:predicted O-methyltransferase YrrM
MTPDLRSATSAKSESRPSDSWLSAASYWTPTDLLVSAWHEHAPFAAWLIDAQRPRTIVELGTHNGFSYFTWCECAVRLGLDTRLTAIDSWQGDDQAGFYEEDVFESVTEKNRQYADRSVLLRGYFSERADDINDGSVDLLHIDGRHGYADVREDFESYLPKTSPRGIVVFHDVTEHQEGFGVFQLWDEVAERYPSFLFQHGHGLGALFVGPDSAVEFADFLAAAETAGDSIRSDYAALGLIIEQRYQDHLATLQLADLRRQRDEAAAEITAMRQSRAWKATAPLRAIRRNVRSRQR